MTAKKRSGSWLWLVLLLAALGGGGWYWNQHRPKQLGPDYKTFAVARGDLTQAVTANGQINAVKNVTVGSQVSGIITDIKVDFNSIVTNGQLVAQIDPSSYQQSVTQADADLASAKAALEFASLDMRRAENLRSNELVSASDYDQKLAELHKAQANVRMKDALLKKAQVDVERTTIYAPIDGVVISRAVDVGQTVAASFNAPTLFNIANDLRFMRIEAMVSEADVGGVLEHQPVTFTVDAFPGRPFKGVVTQVRFAPITNQNVVNYTTVIDVNNEDLRLRPGMTANASIITAQVHDVLRIPNAALRFRPAEGALPKAATNAPAGGGPTGASDKAGGGSEGGSQASGDREAMRKRFENMSPEEREQRRARRAAGLGSGGSGGSGGRGGPEAAQIRTVYLLEPSATPTPGAPQLRPAQIKIGISDGAFTEVLDGLKENDVVVVGVNLSSGDSSAARPGGGPPGSPFGGSPFGGGFRPR